MKKLLPLLLLLQLPVAAVFAQQALQEMIAAEKAFARLADSTNIKTAFLTYLGDSGMAFTPAPTLGKPLYQQYPDGGGKLYWHPAFAVMSSGGDMGFTTGPYIFKPNAEDTSRWQHGHFISVWQKQKDGSWKNMADFGTPHPAVDLKKPIPYPKGFTLTASGSQGRGTKASMLAADSANLHKKQYVTPVAAFFREGHSPVFTVAGQFLVSEGGRDQQWKPLFARVAAAGDFGYTWGTYLSAKGAKGFYLRLWQHTRTGWKILLEARNLEKAAPDGQ